MMIAEVGGFVKEAIQPVSIHGLYALYKLYYIYVFEDIVVNVL